MSVAYTLNPTLAGAAMAGTIAIPAIVKGWINGVKLLYALVSLV